MAASAPVGLCAGKSTLPCLQTMSPNNRSLNAGALPPLPRPGPSEERCQHVPCGDTRSGRRLRANRTAVNRLHANIQGSCTPRTYKDVCMAVLTVMYGCTCGQGSCCPFTVRSCLPPVQCTLAATKAIQSVQSISTASIRPMCSCTRLHALRSCGPPNVCRKHCNAVSFAGRFTCRATRRKSPPNTTGSVVSYTNPSHSRLT